MEALGRLAADKENAKANKDNKSKGKKDAKATGGAADSPLPGLVDGDKVYAAACVQLAVPSLPPKVRRWKLNTC